MVTSEMCVVLRLLENVISVFEQLLQKGNKIRSRIRPHGHANLDLLTDMTFINGLSLDSAV